MDPSQPDAADRMTAVVTTPSGTLNLRASPSSTAQVLRQIPPHTVLAVLEKENDWSKVEYLGLTGYVMNAFLRFQTPGAATEPENKPSEEEPSLDHSYQTAYVNTQSGSLNLRRQPGRSSSVLTTIPRNASVTVSAYGAEWSAVRYGAYQGYVMTSFLRFADDHAAADESKPEGNDHENNSIPSTPSKPDETDEPENPYVTIGGVVLDVTLEAPSSVLHANINQETIVYEMCSADGREIITIFPDSEVEILLAGELWCRIAYQDVQGYCQTSNLDVKE